MMSGNKLLVCPYDEVHKVKASRMQLHITRCRMNHLNETKFTCPFNATHVMPYQEKDFHLLHCFDKAPLDRMLAESLNKNNPFKGRTAVPSYSEIQPLKSEETWEEEYESAPGYIPTIERPSGAFVKPQPFLGASAKRQLYRELHHTSENVDHKSSFNSGSSISAPIPRQPKQPSEASKFEIKTIVKNFPCLGLGRGMIPASKIAANFNLSPAINKSTASSTIYSSVNDTKQNANFIRDEIWPFGFGRGKARSFVTRK